MSKPHVEMYRGDEGDEWPPAIRERFVYLSEYARKHDFSVLCAVGLHHERKRLSAFFAPHATENPHLPELLDDLAQMFTLMAKRLRQ